MFLFIFPLPLTLGCPSGRMFERKRIARALSKKMGFSLPPALLSASSPPTVLTRSYRATNKY
jgi:hypothetical protein